MTSFLKGSIAALAVAGIALVTPARADAIIVINFENLLLDGGSVTASGGGNAQGEDIIFTSVFLRDGGVVQSGLQCGEGPEPDADTACMLDFDTATGEFTVTAVGGLWDAGPDMQPFTSDEPGTLVVAPGTIILTGTINTFSFIPGTFFFAMGMDTKDAEMLIFFGLDPNAAFEFRNTEILIGLSGDNVQEADLTNTMVPEPGSLALLGLGLVAAGRAVRRRRRATRD